MSKTTIFEKHEVLHFYLLFFITIPFAYFTSGAINQFFGLFLLLMFWNSRRNYFWFAFAFLLISRPMGLFHLDGQHIVKFNVTKGISFYYFDLFLATAFFKAFRKKNVKLNFLFGRPLFILLIYLIFLFIASLILGPTDKDVIFNYFRAFSSLSLFYSLPILINNKNNSYYKLILLLLPSLILILIGQIYQLITTFPVEHILSPQAYSQISYTNGDYVRANQLSLELLFILLIFILFFLNSHQIGVKKNRLILYLTMATLSIFLSGTRIYIAVFFVIFFLYFLWIEKRFFSSFRKIGITVLLIVLLFYTVPKLQPSIKGVYARLNLLTEVAKGNIEADGSANFRINSRLPMIVNKIYQSPIWGLGFTRKFYSVIGGKIYTGDYHVGNFNLLANCGLVGFLLFSYFWYFYLLKIKHVRNLLSKEHVYHKSILMFSIGLLALLFMHFTSYQIFGFTLQQKQFYFLAVFFVLSDFILKEALLIGNIKNYNRDSLSPFN